MDKPAITGRYPAPAEGVAVQLWRIQQGGGFPLVDLAARSRAHAIARYDELCGITGRDGPQPAAELLVDYPHPLTEDVQA